MNDVTGDVGLRVVFGVAAVWCVGEMAVAALRKWRAWRHRQQEACRPPWVVYDDVAAWAQDEQAREARVRERLHRFVGAGWPTPLLSAEPAPVARLRQARDHEYTAYDEVRWHRLIAQMEGVE